MLWLLVGFASCAWAGDVDDSATIVVRVATETQLSAARRAAWYREVDYFPPTQPDLPQPPAVYEYFAGAEVIVIGEDVSCWTDVSGRCVLEVPPGEPHSVVGTRDGFWGMGFMGVLVERGEQTELEVYLDSSLKTVCCWAGRMPRRMRRIYRQARRRYRDAAQGSVEHEAR